MFLRDSHKSFANGFLRLITVLSYDTSAWGRFPTIQSIVNAFDNDPNSRSYQDIGLDGLSDAQEQSFFTKYLNSLQTLVTRNKITPLCLQALIMTLPPMIILIFKAAFMMQYRQAL